MREWLHSEAMDRLATNGAQGMIKIKRVCDTADGEDSVRFLVDRLWPIGIQTDELKAEF